MIFYQILFIASFLLLSCASAHKTQDAQTPMERCKQLAAEKYKTDVEFLIGENKDFVLCRTLSKSTALQPQQSVLFFVYDLKNDVVVIEESYADGSVRWLDGRAIEVNYHLGVASKDPSVPHSVTYVFDLITKQRSNSTKDIK